MTRSRRSAALELSEELLTDIELGRLPAADVARKASRLARLLDDLAAQRWLMYEIEGFPTPLDADAAAAAQRSGRQMQPAADGTRQFWTVHVAGIQASVAANERDLAGYEGAVSSSDYAVVVERERAQRRAALVTAIASAGEMVERIKGSIHRYIAERHHELRFGSAVESAFGVVRATVDERVTALVPDAPQMLASALENAVSENPEHWAGAAATCRRLLKTTADAIRPSGPPVNERPMSDAHYINRLVDWISCQDGGTTREALIVADLKHLGARLDSVADAGHKGAHAHVSRSDAARFIAGTYLLLGDILELAQGSGADAAPLMPTRDRVGEVRDPDPQ